MKKYLLMIAAVFTMALTTVALCSCGGDDYDEPATKQHTLQLNLTSSDAALSLYPDLSFTYKMPGAAPKTVKVDKKTMTINDTYTGEGKIDIAFNGTLDESKVVDTQKYLITVDVVYHKDKGIGGNETMMFGNTGDKLKELNKFVEYEGKVGN